MDLLDMDKAIEEKAVEQEALREFGRVAAAAPRYPGGFSGRGVVIPAGGPIYFPCAWVCLNALRDTGCSLPVEIWHLGDSEMTDPMRRLLAPLGAVCVDAFSVRRQHPTRLLGGWELKPYAVLHCRFREVLLLDADNFPLADPSFLFDAEPYRQHGAIFWPDFARLSANHPVWRLTGAVYRNEPEFETGQMIIDKRRCWPALSLTQCMNQYSDFWYRLVYGDKETFHLAWRTLAMDYAMPTRGIERLPGTMCQHDFAGRRLFQHRNRGKWRLDRPNAKIPGFLGHEAAERYLDSLRSSWTDYCPAYCPAGASAVERELAQEVCGRRWLYRRVGHDRRAMSFAADGSIAQGAAGQERTWTVRQSASGPELLIGDGMSLTCRLIRERAGRWTGQWEIFERMPVELVDWTENQRLRGGSQGECLELTFVQ